MFRNQSLPQTGNLKKWLPVTPSLGHNFPHGEARLGLERVESLDGEQTRSRARTAVRLVRSAHDLRGELTSPLCA